MTTKVSSHIYLTKNIYEKLRKISFISRKSRSVLIEEALIILFKTPGGKQ